MKHSLSLLIPTTMDDWSLLIQDTSVYTDLIPISCPTLQVLMPGFITATTVNDNSTPPLAPGFSRIFTACSLEIQTSGCGMDFNPLPDGIYVIKYSVSPNDIVYVEYNHLRITKALQKYDALLCELELPPCSPAPDKKLRLAELMEIKGYLEAAKATVEVCHNAEKGMALYNYALKRLDKLNCTTC